METSSQDRHEIPVIVAARNEENNIARCLCALQEAAVLAEASLPVHLQIIVGADRCTDRTVEIAKSLGVAVIITSGGKVAAQRACLQKAPFFIFCDADVSVSPETLRGLCRVMLENKTAEVAYPQKRPLPPRRQTWLAKAVHHYTRDEGFQQKRTWFDGKCFAIRRFAVPTREELTERIGRLRDDHFYAFHEGLTIDDVFLSRWLVHNHGVEALQQAPEGILWFRNPETLSGMYSYYRRVLRELERLDQLFPEMRPTGVRFGYRRTDWKRFLAASQEAQLAYLTFQVVDRCFGPIYIAEKFYYQYLASKDCNAWPVISDTKGL